MRPILLNGIPDVVGRPDLGDRALAVTLAAIEDDQRLMEAEFWRRFDAAAPGIFGALLDAVWSALRNIDKVKLNRRPRMRISPYGSRRHHRASAGSRTAYRCHNHPHKFKGLAQIKANKNYSFTL
jgi:hypothetical protein